MDMEAKDPIRKILLVDDEPEILDLLGDILKPICDEIITAGMASRHSRYWSPIRT